MSYSAFFAGNANTIGTVGSTVINTYMSLRNNKRQKELADAVMRRNIAITAQMITIDLEQILKSKQEVSDQAAAQNLQILKQKRAAEGAANVAAAVTGAAGQRVELAQAQAVDGVAADAISQLAKLTEKAQEDLIDQARFMTRKRMMDLANSAPIPKGGPSILELALPSVADGLAAVKNDYDFRKDREAKIASTALKTTVPGTTGVQTKVDK